MVSNFATQTEREVFVSSVAAEERCNTVLHDFHNRKRLHVGQGVH
jgi:hypothetical protein